jgi:hypothetical protein
MQITVVRYRRLQSHDHGYGHDPVEAEARVEDHEHADEAMAGLKAWVGGQLSHLKQARDLCEQLESLGRKTRDEERRLRQLTEEVKRNREVIASHEKLSALAREQGIDGGDLIDDGVPF